MAAGRAANSQIISGYPAWLASGVRGVLA